MDNVLLYQNWYYTEPNCYCTVPNVPRLYYTVPKWYCIVPNGTIQNGTVLYQMVQCFTSLQSGTTQYQMGTV